MGIFDWLFGKKEKSIGKIESELEKKNVKDEEQLSMKRKTERMEIQSNVGERQKPVARHTKDTRLTSIVGETDEEWKQKIKKIKEKGEYSNGDGITPEDISTLVDFLDKRGSSIHKDNIWYDANDALHILVRESAIPTLVDLSKSKHPLLRYHGARCLGLLFSPNVALSRPKKEVKYGPEIEEAISILISMIDDSTPIDLYAEGEQIEVRWTVVDALSDLANSSDENVSRSTLRALPILKKRREELKGWKEKQNLIAQFNMAIEKMERKCKEDDN